MHTKSVNDDLQPIKLSILKNRPIRDEKAKKSPMRRYFGSLEVWTQRVELPSEQMFAKLAELSRAHLSKCMWHPGSLL
jgi:hypothetical protein